jgi:hypothetical protein
MRIGDREDELKVRVVLHERALQVLKQVGVQSLEGTQNGDTRRVSGRAGRRVWGPRTVAVFSATAVGGRGSSYQHEKSIDWVLNLTRSHIQECRWR